MTALLTAAIILCSVITVCFTWSQCIKMQHEFDERSRIASNHLELAKALEKKLEEMEELKVRMEMLLIKNGLGRK